jgi:hypothetical protein
MRSLATGALPQLNEDDPEENIQVARFGRGGVENVETGTVELAEGQLTVEVTFSYEKSTAAYIFNPPPYIKDPNDPPQTIIAPVVSQSTTGFVVKLSAAPSTDLSTMHWGVAVVDTRYVSEVPDGGPSYAILPGDGDLVRYLIQDTGGQVFNVAAYGALDNGTDQTATIQGVIDLATAVAGIVFIPATATGYYVTTLNISNTITLMGVSQPADGGSMLLSGTNAPLLNVTGRCTIEGIALRGAQDIAKTEQDLIRVTTTNGVQIRNCYLSQGYNNVHFIDSFYCTLAGCVFGESAFSSIRTTGGTASGTDLKIFNCDILGGFYSTQYCIMLDNVGAMNILGLRCVHSNVAVGGLCVNTLASGAGSSNFGDGTIECGTPGVVPALILNGTSTRPILRHNFSNFNFGGGWSGGHVIELGYCSDVHFSLCTVYGAGGTHGYYIKNQLTSCRITDNTFNLSGYPIIADTYRLTSQQIIDLGNAKITDDLIITNPRFAVGSRALMYLHAGLALPIGNVDVRGGSIGLAADLLLDRPAFSTGKRIKIDVPGYNKGPISPPSVAATGVEVANDRDVDVMVYLEGFSNLSVTINDSGVSGAIVWAGGGGSFLLHVGGKIRLNYSGSAGTWFWNGL